MVDRFMKMVNFILIIKYLNVISLARLMDRQIYLYYGVLRGIVNDYNLLFTSKFRSELCDIIKTKCKLLIAYYP